MKQVLEQAVSNPQKSMVQQEVQSGAKGLPGGALFALIVANMIGTGVFTTSGLALSSVQRREAVLLAWFVAGVHALLGAVSYTWLVQRHPYSGGEYAILSRVLHPGVGYVAGWLSLFAGFAAPVAAAAHGLEAYAGWEGAHWLGILVIVGMALLHGAFSAWGVRLQNLAVGVKIVALLVFVLCGTWVVRVPWAEMRLSAVQWSSFGAICVWVSFSYTGWNAAIYVAGELRDRQKGLWCATLGAVFLVLVLYLGLNLIFLYAAPAVMIAGKTNMGSIAAQRMGGYWVDVGLSWLVMLALVTSISSMSMAGPRVAWQMSRDGYLPRWFGNEQACSSYAVYFQAGIALLVFSVSSLEKIFAMMGLSLLTCSALTVSCLFVEHWRGNYRPASMGYPLVPLLFVGSTLAMGGWMAWRQPLEALAALGIVMVGAVVYQVQRRFL